MRLVALLGAVGAAAAASFFLLPPPTLWLLLLPPLLLPVVAAGGCVAWLALRPKRLIRPLDQVGYLPEPGWTRAQSAARMRRNRRTGQVLPSYPNGWFRLLGSDELARGEVRNVAALGEQFAVFRDLDGKVYVLDAYCPHLGANLAIGGRVVGDCIECPFHGWMFSGKDGSCVKIPYAKKVPEFASTKVWPSCEVNDMIMVWYHCDGTSPAWQVAEQEEVLSPDWAFRAATEHFVSAHIEEIPENAADVAHLSFLHNPSVLSGNDLRFTDNHCWAFFRHTWEAEWQPEPEPNGHCSVMLLTHHVAFFGKPVPFLDLHVTARQIGPGLVTLALRHAFLGKGLIVQTVIPLEPLLQHVVHQIYYPRNIPSFIAKLILWAEGVQFERDVMIWNNKKFLSKPLLVKEDAAILRHRRWFSQFYSQNSWKLNAQKGQLDW
ncbi:cholesterol 7-desaturase-like [Pseudonaja textilis]|uniref:cholesterol 7-desaturase-like n=1 Tax=Pseudonaja textilis TaxID=8673 RepID=UPI000EA9E763|nr:cholesterol 7-desaturase-like [Pseudonaja textilis]